MAQALNIPFLHYIYDVFIYVALLAWIVTFTGMLRSFFSQLAKLKYQTNKDKLTEVRSKQDYYHNSKDN